MRSTDSMLARRLRSALLAASALFAIAPAAATDTVTYVYDASGRLVHVGHSGGVNDGASSTYSYDKADNRTNVTVTGPVAPSFSINSPAAVVEGGPVVFTVTKSGAASGTLSVDYATAGGTATSGTDFTATSGTLTFLAADTTKTISVPTTDDAILESAENFAVTLSNASPGSTITTSQGTGTISDNEVPPPSFAVGDAAATEGGALAFTVTRSGTTAGSFSIAYASADGTATAGADYTAGSGSLTFAAGVATQTITISTTDDATIESAETVLLNISGATGGATISDAQGVGTINDNDAPPPSFAVSNATAVTEGAPLVFTITKTGATPSTFSVNYATSGGTATAGSDYSATAGTLTFAPADTSKTVSVPTIDDSVVESNETVRMNLSGATGGATISDALGSGTIHDNDTVPNNPPVANTDNGSTTVCKTIFINPVANDTDPDGDLPLATVSVTDGTGGTFTLMSSTSVMYQAPLRAGGYTGTYVVQDSRGAQSTGTIQVNVGSGTCTLGGGGGGIGAAPASSQTTDTQPVDSTAAAPADPADTTAPAPDPPPSDTPPPTGVN